MITIVTTTPTNGSQESVLFQPVLKAYPTHHSWIITAHISLRKLERQWISFIWQLDKT